MAAEGEQWAKAAVTERRETVLDRCGSTQAQRSCGLWWQSIGLTYFIKKKGNIYFWQRTQ